MEATLTVDHPLFFKEVDEIHKRLYETFEVKEQMAFSWMEDVLEDAKKIFSSGSNPYMPIKTPAAKQNGRRKRGKQNLEASRKLVNNFSDDDYIPPKEESTDSKKASKKRPVDTDSDSDFECTPITKVCKVEATTPAKRTTRAASRAATTTQAKKSKNTKNKPTKKTRSQEPVQNIHKLMTDTEKEEDISIHEVIETWTQPVSQSVLAPPPFDKKVSVTLCKTPIQNFSTMNVKEKAHAYEEIMTKAETPVVKSANKSVTKTEAEETPVKKSMSPRTPANASIPQESPETTVRVSEIYLPAIKLPDINDLDDSIVDTPKVGRPSNCRRSVRKSLKSLPSSTKISTLHKEPEPLEANTEPAKTRTRLRLKKKDKTEEVTDTESVTSDIKDETENTNEVSMPTNKRKTRSQGRDSGPSEEVHTSNKNKEDDNDNIDGVDNDETEVNVVNIPGTPRPTRSTRTKTRQVEAQSAFDRLKNNENSGACDDGNSKEANKPTRTTRSKMRKPELEVTDNIVASPAPRVTRTKTRKRQHDEESDSERCQPKRSCTMSAKTETVNKTPVSTDESSDEEQDSPKSPPANSGRPIPSFLNSLNKNSKMPVVPSNLKTDGQLKTFIMKNSPAPKRNAKELQEKRRQELLEKQKKEQERRVKQEEETKKKMEEMRKKREEKMKKVQELKERREQAEKMNRLRIEKRLAEKCQVTQKLREDKIKEDREKQKLRLQKMEEAEKRRKQEEEERRRKLKELQEQEKSHEAMLQRKKEYEEQERLQKIEEEKRRAAERQQEIERERERERERLLQIEEEKQREWHRKKEEREKQQIAERAERERMELEKKREKELLMKKEIERVKEMERLKLAEQEKLREEERKRNEEIKKMVDKHNSQLQQNKQLPKPEFNKTRSLDEPTVKSANNDSYEMTPKRLPQPSTAENYNIDDLNSGDETDDEDCPRKRIPDWALGSDLKTLLLKQHLNPPDLNAVFGIIEPPDLNAMFAKKKARFNKRTSSAHWDTPILKPGLLGRT
ncbi:hypothetical protein ACF0H5_008415 [Mactra antiquata]